MTCHKSRYTAVLASAILLTIVALLKFLNGYTGVQVAPLMSTPNSKQMIRLNELRPLKPTGPQSDKWIVLTTIAAPTPDVKFLSRLPGWRVLVVGDVKTPSNWTYPNCEFLDIDKQKSLSFLSAELIPERSYTRKNIGYIFAIVHGAKFIYETDDDNRPLDGLEGFDYGPHFSGIEFAGQGLFNPYHHFGQSTLWPRGFPLTQSNQKFSHQYIAFITKRQLEYKHTVQVFRGYETCIFSEVLRMREYIVL